MTEKISKVAIVTRASRGGGAADIAAVVTFLVGPDGGWVNGQVLRANDGMV
jgi:3-oxoacyl-[acyl-carrier protein] reductase